VSRYGVDVAAIERVGVAALRRAMGKGQIVVGVNWTDRYQSNWPFTSVSIAVKIELVQANRRME